MSSKLILIGGGGHCKSCIDVIEMEGKYHIAGIVDMPEKLHQKILGYPILGTDQDLTKLVEDFDRFLITIGQIKDFTKRRELYDHLKQLNAQLPVIISPLAYVSKHAGIEEGSIVMHNAMINAGARIGKNCIINSKALIEHDARIGDHCHIATASVINGGVHVDSETFIGSNTVTKEYVEIGRKSVVGANLKIDRNVPNGSMLK